jgi:hypothetical protein
MPLTHQQSFLIPFLLRTAIVLCDDEILPGFLLPWAMISRHLQPGGEFQRRGTLVQLRLEASTKGIDRDQSNGTIRQQRRLLEELMNFASNLVSVLQIGGILLRSKWGAGKAQGGRISEPIRDRRATQPPAHFHHNGRRSITAPS